MRRKIIQFIIIFVGICLIAYPWISNYVYEHAAQSTVNTYSEKVKEVNKDPESFGSFHDILQITDII